MNYPVMEIFYSIQGEGFWKGTPATFIRLAGCNIQCHWCDVKESWSTQNYPQLSPENIINKITNFPSKHIIITGGEPTMYDLAPLTSQLKKHNFITHLETSGAYPITGNIDWITLSPKKFKLPLTENYQKANELKIIVYNKHDLIWAKELQKKVTESTLLYLQPEWSKFHNVKKLIFDFVKNNPEWNISLQIHKFLQVP